MREGETQPKGDGTHGRGAPGGASEGHWTGYSSLLASAAPAPHHWREPCVHSECTLHQLSPYIGKLKSTIARDLVSAYSCPGDVVLDPFAGSGTIPLEAVIANRRAVAADVSPYAALLCRAKLHAPETLEVATDLAESTLEAARRLPGPDLRRVPKWVRAFFHRETLREALSFAKMCRREDQPFLMACLLGILHHQRPGFLSFPSSHLVPYLRSKKYPPERFPEMYAYRDLRSRLLRKIERAYKRDLRGGMKAQAGVEASAIEQLAGRDMFDSVITSPPYMNALDYWRDNRLRLWFLDPALEVDTEDRSTRSRGRFGRSIACLARIAESRLKSGKYCVLVIGELVTRGRAASPSEVACAVFQRTAPSLELEGMIRDSIPDVRRARRECSATKAEHILIYRKAHHAEAPPRA